MYLSDNDNDMFHFEDFNVSASNANADADTAQIDSLPSPFQTTSYSNISNLSPPSSPNHHDHCIPLAPTLYSFPANQVQFVTDNKVTNIQLNEENSTSPTRVTKWTKSHLINQIVGDQDFW